MNENIALGIIQEIEKSAVVFPYFKRIIRGIIVDTLLELGLVERKQETHVSD